jgi:protease YdgD
VLAVAALPSEAIIAAAAAGQIFQISYHRDFMPWRPAYSQPCAVARSFTTADWATIARDFADPEQLVLHTCDTGGASSGSPLILETAAGLAVVAINIGTYVQSKVLMENGQVTKRLKADTVANTAVNSSVFAAKLLAFRQAAILASPAQIRELQTILKQRQLFAASIDGNYGLALREAIEAYERARDLPVTGLATEALLQRLKADLRPAAKGS